LKSEWKLFQAQSGAFFEVCDGHGNSCHDVVLDFYIVDCIGFKILGKV